MENESYTAEMAQWEEERLQALNDPNGYLSLVGLCWLQPGENTFGSAVGNACQFPVGLPDKIGTYTVSKSGITVSINPGVTVLHNGEVVTEMSVLTDRDEGGSTILEIGTFSWFVIKRGEALAIRIRNSESELLQNFPGVDRYENDNQWRIRAEFTPHAEPITVPIPTILGTDADMVSPGTISINVAGEKRELTALKEADPKRFFLIVADGLAGSETYGGGRFLTTEPVDEAGNVVVDFNKATNPPCAFTPWATCPRPPDENRFSVDIPAGEKVFRT